MKAWLLALLTGLALAQGVQAEDRLYIRAGRLVDVEAGRVLSDQLVQIDGERITAVSAFRAPPKDGRLIDWSKLTVLPGLIDMHTHLADAEQSENIADPLMTSAADSALLGAAHARATLMAGFTTVRDVGTWRAFTDVALREAIAKGLVPGPRMWVAGAYLTIPGGGGEVTGLADDVGIPADMRRGVVQDEADMHRKAADLLAHHVDFLKLIATGAVLTVGTEPGQSELTEGEMRAAVEEAAKRGTYATAHAHGAEGMKAAIRAGVRSIEHGSLMDDEAIAMMKAKGVWLVADIYNGDFINSVGTQKGWPAETLRKNRETTDAQRDGFRKAVKAGVKIAYGTDAGVYPHGWNARQLPYMVRYGMTPMQALQSATTSAAALMGRSKDVGAISPGHYADLIAVAGDPLKDISILNKVPKVIKGGMLVKDDAAGP